MQTTVDVIFVNGYNATKLKCDSAEVSINPTPPKAIKPGEEVTFTIKIAQGACTVDSTTVFTARAGTSIEVKLHTTGGKEYPKLLTLP